MKILLTFILSSLIVLSQAQIIRFLDMNSYEPVSNVTVQTTSGSFSGISDELGHVKLPALKENEIILIDHTSYYDERFTMKEINKEPLILLVPRVIKIDEVEVSASRNNQRVSQISNVVEVIEAKQIQFQNPQTSADLFEKTGKLFVQRSQMGGGSPIIRGFEANKVLIAIDGIRMNNAIYRGGHLQNVITIDNSALEKTEVVYGPGSLLFGSDALGGVMHFVTKKPQYALRDKNELNGGAKIRYGSVNGEKNVNVNLNYGAKKLALFTNVSFSDFENLRSGKVRPAEHGDWGKNNRYVAIVDGKDTVIENRNPHIQVGTGYTQFDAMQKLRYKLGDKQELNIMAQYSTSSNLPRYDRLQENTTDSSGSTLPTFALWYYGPQTRWLTYLNLNSKQGNKYFDEFDGTISYQNIEESRINRRFQSNSTDHNIEKVDILALNLNFNKRSNERSSWLYGFESNLNWVESSAFTELNGVQIENETRYPDEGSVVFQNAVYAKHLFEFNEKWSASQGLRLNQVYLRSRFGDDQLEGLGLDEIELQNSAGVFALDLIHTPNEKMKWYAIISSGFRSPNVDDIGKVFDPAPATVVVPNADLEPEYIYNGEIGARKLLGSKARIEFSAYYTWLRNFISRMPYSINGRDSIVFNGVLSEVYANQNGDKAFITGLSADVIVELAKFIRFQTVLNYTYGQDITNDLPLSHIPPVHGRSAIFVEKKRYKVEFSALYNGTKPASRYSPNKEDNLNEALPGGTPSWVTFNLLSSFKIDNNLKAGIGIENIFDVHYRTFSSGISAPGRNVSINLSAEF